MASISPRWLGALALVFLLAACPGAEGGGSEGSSDEGTGDSCTPAEVVACECMDGSLGTRACEPDGMSYGPCACGADDDASGTMSGSAGTGGSASATDGPGSSGPEPGTGTTADGSTGPAATSASEESGPGSAPTVQINHPGDGDQRPAGVPIPFLGEASDPEDGPLAGASLVWTDSIEGELGQGDTIESTLRTLGDHTITLTATDADGNVSEDSIVLVVFE